MTNETNERPTYRGVEFCDLSAYDKELVNQGIIEADEPEPVRDNAPICFDWATCKPVRVIAPICDEFDWATCKPEGFEAQRATGTGLCALAESVGDFQDADEVDVVTLADLDYNHPELVEAIINDGIDLTEVIARMNEHLDKEEGIDYDMARVLAALLAELASN